jgi:hypothetical protein
MPGSFLLNACLLAAWMLPSPYNFVLAGLTGYMRFLLAIQGIDEP